MRTRRIAVAYFLVQAVAVAAWWVLLVAAPETRAPFLIRNAPFSVLGSFALGDLGLIALGSAIVGMRGGRGWSVHAAWLVTGALLYATCFVVAAAVSGASSALGAALMVPAAVASIMASAILTRDAHADTLPPGTTA